MTRKQAIAIVKTLPAETLEAIATICEHGERIRDECGDGTVVDDARATLENLADDFRGMAKE